MPLVCLKYPWFSYSLIDWFIDEISFFQISSSKVKTTVCVSVLLIYKVHILISVDYLNVIPLFIIEYFLWSNWYIPMNMYQLIIKGQRI